MLPGEYQELAWRTAKPLQRDAALYHALMGLTSDWGEFVTHVKAITVYGKDPKTARPKMVEELGDASWFVAYLCTLKAWKLVDVVERPQYDTSVDWTVDDPRYYALQGAQAIGGLAYEFHDSGGFQAEPPLSLADLWVCIQRVAEIYDISIEEEVFPGNIEKLRIRYPDKYTDEAAIVRADKIGTDEEE